MIYGTMDLNKHGSRISEVDVINTKTWADAIGFSVYAYEGIGVILPI